MSVASENKPLLTLALDRIVTVEEAANEQYIENTLIDLSTYYSDVLGVTKSPNQKDCEVYLKLIMKMRPM